MYFFNANRGQIDSLNSVPFFRVILSEIFKRVVSPSIDLIQCTADGVLITNIYHLNRVALAPCLLVQIKIILNP